VSVTKRVNTGFNLGVFIFLKIKCQRRNSRTIESVLSQIQTMTPQAPTQDLPYMRDMHQALVADQQHWVGGTLLLIAAALTAAVVWASASQVEEITTGTARVVPSSHEQVIQSLESGILTELLVKEGDVVNAGQALLKIDPTKANASLKEGSNKVLAMRATAARLRAEARGTQPVFPKDVQANPELLRNETHTYQTKRNAVEQGSATLQRSKALLGREIAMTEPMVAKGLVAEVELLRLRRQYNEVDLQMQERFNKWRADAAGELIKVEAELSQTNEVVNARADQVKRTIIYAPLRGTVKNIRINTIGGVIQAAQDILEIVPFEDKLLVEAKIRPHDVAFLRPGLPATVKISAYDYSIYGALQGEVTLISPDTLKEERSKQTPDDERYYRVLVKADASTLRRAGKELPIMPGMTANVEIRTGEKSVLDYILKPVLKAREALRER
jgi:membrane fusion protein, adhesin transport system